MGKSDFESFPKCSIEFTIKFMERSLKLRLSTRTAHKIEESEKMDVCDASSINGNTTSDMNKTTRTNDSVILVLSDDEDFAGFGAYNNGKRFFPNVTIIISISCLLFMYHNLTFPISLHRATITQAAKNQRRTSV